MVRYFLSEKQDKNTFFRVEMSLKDDETTLATEATASQQPGAHRGFRKDSVCPE